MKISDLEILDLNEEDDLLEENEIEETDDIIETDEIDEVEETDEEVLDWKKELISWIFTIALTVAVVFVLKNYIIINASVPTGSMENTIMP